MQPKDRHGSVKIVREKGFEEDELHRFEVNPERDVPVSGGDDEKQNDAIQKKQVAETFKTFTLDGLTVTSPKWRAKVKMQALDIPDDEIRMAFDLQDEGGRVTPAPDSSRGVVLNVYVSQQKP